MRLVDGLHQLVVLGDLGARRRHVHLALDAVVGEALGEPAHHVEHLAPRDAHRLRRRHADVEKQVGVMRRARDAPAEAAFDRAHVHDRLRARGTSSTGRPPTSGSTRGPRSRTSCDAQNRVLVALALAEGRVDEVPLHPDPQPESTEVAKHDLPLGRLAEQAHVGDAAVRDQIARAGGIAAVLRSLRLAVLRLLDLAADRSDQQVAAQPDTCVLQRAHRLDVAGERALHVRDAEPVEAAVALERLGLETRERRAARARGRSTRCPCAR